MNRHLVKMACVLAFGFGLVLMAGGPAAAFQITICQSCTTAPGGDPNIISDPSAFNMFLQGENSTTAKPTLIIIAEYDGGAQPSVSIGGTSLNLATAAPGGGTFGLTANTVLNFTGGPNDNVFEPLGILDAGSSLNLGNMADALTALNIPAPPNGYNLYAFLYDSGLTNTPTVVNVSGVSPGTFFFAYGCSEDTTPTNCNPTGPGGGNVSATVFTNSGLTNGTPEPTSLLLLGAGLAGMGIWRRKATKI